ncbi:MAG: carboxypeptidase regulatory-like domain-containing protein [Bacteroidia bacterium]|nr:carboxypeptidase regulatory-like domain-containing protein [Bacteroidia bacterium]
MNQLVRRIAAALMLAFAAQAAFAQVTTASFFGRVTDANGQPLVGATVVATHQPSGSRYGTTTREDGRYNLPGVRIGGPYSVAVTYIGYKTTEEQNISLTLGQNFQLNLLLAEEDVTSDEVLITATRNEVRDGAATNISTEVINTMPTLSRRLSDFTRLTAQSNGTSFGGQDNRLNNITVDGSLFNNSFGLGGQPGDRTGVSPISLDAIEEVQVNLSPFDVRQAGFVGAGINAVTRSGTNEISASVYHLFRNESFQGDSARGVLVPKGDFSYYQSGLRVGGPIIKDKLFFFVSGEVERRSAPATTWVPSNGDGTLDGNESRVTRTDLDNLRNFLRDNFDYETGDYEGYNLGTKADKFLARLDYNVDEKNKISLRYTYLDSDQDVLISNSSSLGFGNRQPSLNAFSYRNSNYTINEDINSVIGEWNTNLGRFSNNLIIGYTFQKEDRGDFDDTPNSTVPNFPLVEIREQGDTYISFGYEPFTPSNRLNYSTFQIQDNATLYVGSHKITAGFNLERLAFENVFFPGSQSVYVYNSLADFYADANGYLSNPTRDTTSVTYSRFQLRYSALEGGAEPVQPSRVTYMGLYAQDEWAVNNNLNITAGVRIDVPVFDKTGYLNTAVEDMTFLDQNDEPVKYSTAKLPNPQLLVSPRIGFSWNVTADGSTRVRGGTGIFTGRPAFVWISNQIGNNGVLTGFTQVDNAGTRRFPFDPNIAAHVPATPTLPSSYELALTSERFRFPQVWRSNLAIEQKLPGGFVATVEGILSRDVNGVYYTNANLPATDTTFNGPDNRPRYLTNRINSSVVNAIVLQNTNQGYAYSLTFQLERPFKNGLYAKAAYNFSEAKNITNAGSIAAGSFNGNPIVFDPNRPELAFSNDDQRHRVIGALAYRLEYGGSAGGATQISLFYEGRTQGRVSYTYTGDMNGDSHNANDLIFVPENASDLVFQEYSSGQVTFTAQQQAEAFDAFIDAHPYLSTRRGQYAERNGYLLPWVNRIDFSVAQDFYVMIGGKRNTIQVRGDVLNIGNLLNSDWGVGQAVANSRILNPRGVNAQGVPQYRFVQGGGTGSPLLTRNLRYTNGLADVWQVQLSLRYIFN